MTHFYFHTWRDDQRLADEVGLDMPSQALACDLAARDLGEMARELLHVSSKVATLGVDIADTKGMVLARLRLEFVVESCP